MEASLREGRQARSMIGDMGRQIEECNARTDKRLDQMTVAVESTSDEIKATSDENRELFRQMLKAQNSIFERAA